MSGRTALSFGLLLAGFAALFALLLAAPPDSHAQQAALRGNVANGIVIYQQRCANCHGPVGMGDGELAANLPNPVPAIGSPAYLQSAIPLNMYDIITNGNIANGMPLFGEGSSNPLSEQERWDVIAAAFALGTSAEPMRAAGANATDAQRSILENADWAGLNNATIAQQLGDGLDADAATALVDWGRLSFSADYFLGNATVSGIVQNGTINQPQPGGTVTLVTFEGFDRASTFEAPVDENGQFTVEVDDVPADWFGRIETTYGGIDYVGEFLRFTPEAIAVESDVTVFETTDNDGGLELQLFNTVIEVAPDALTVNQLYAFGNVSTRAFAGGLTYALPDSAENVSISRVEADQFFPVELDANGQDSVVIFPGDNGLTTFLRYRIPYGGEASVAHPVGFVPRRAALSVPSGLSVDGESWVFQRTDSAEGTDFDNYTGNLTSSFDVTISGFPEFATDPATGDRLLLRDEQQELIVGGASLLVVVGASLLLVRSWQQQPSSDPTPLLQELADLDDAYAAKKVKRKPYQARRKELMQQVVDRWERGKGNEKRN